MTSSPVRRILHVDMDAFFAAVEQLDHPEYRGRPVVVGADPKGGRGRGVVAACSYEARRYGIHSALPIGRAWQRCPDAVYVRPRGARYAEVSRAVFAVFARFTDRVEPLSIDEAFLDVTGSERLLGNAGEIAHTVKQAIRDELGLVASVGVAPNKFVAKIASDLEKPDGLVVVPADQVLAFLHPLPISRLWGVGPKTGQQLQRRGIRTIGDLSRWPREALRNLLGEGGEQLWRLARGEDERPVLPGAPAQSIGKETTFARDQVSTQVVHTTLLALSDQVARRLRQHGYRAAGVTLKYRNADFATWTRALQLPQPTQHAQDLYQAVRQLLRRVPDRSRPVRLVGVTATHLSPEATAGPVQLGLFEQEAADGDKMLLARTVDAIHDRFGSSSLVRAAMIEGEAQPAPSLSGRKRPHPPGGAKPPVSQS